MSSKELSARRRGTGSGLAFVVSGPSGAGKNTAIDDVIKRVPGLAYSVSHTTRAPRRGEAEGVNYYFVPPGRFRSMVEAGEFLEHATYLGDQYGTSKSEFARLARLGVDVVLNIDVQGAHTLRHAGAAGFSLVFVFFTARSLDQLGERLRARGSESESEIAERLRTAAQEMETLPIFDYLVVNDEVGSGVRELVSIVEAERLRVLSREPDAWAPPS